MKSAFSSLVRLYLGSIFGWKPLSERRGAKEKLKLAGIALLFLLVVGDFGVIFVMSSLSQYEALKPLGLQGLLLLNAAILSTMLVFVFGFIMALSTWSLSPAERGLLALPIDPRSLLAAKMIVVYLSEVAFALFIMGVNLVVFGIKEGPPPGFYIDGLLVALVLPLIPLALVYAFLVPFLSLARFMRNRNAILLVAGLLGIAFALGFNVMIQAPLSRLADPAWVLANYAGPGTLLNLVGSAWPPSWLAWRSLASASSGALLEPLAWLGLLAGLGMAVSALVILGLGRTYAGSLLDFDEGRLRRLAGGSVRGYIAGEGAPGRFARGPLLLALVRRESRLMNREPIYFLNGPLIVLLMPAILALYYVVQRDTFADLLPLVATLREGPRGLLIAAAAGAFLGSGTSITATALSRDAKALPWIRALPIPTRDYLFAKLGHGLIWALFGALVGAGGGAWLIGLGPALALAAVFMALAFASLVNLAGLWLDTAMPRLEWDNPTAAMKQNPNSVFAVLGSMGLIAALGALSLLLPLGPAGFVLAYGGGAAALFALLLALYPAWAERRLAALEI